MIDVWYGTHYFNNTVHRKIIVFLQLPILSFIPDSTGRRGGRIIFYFSLGRGFKTAKELQLKITEG